MSSTVSLSSTSEGDVFPIQAFAAINNIEDDEEVDLELVKSFRNFQASRTFLVTKSHNPIPPADEYEEFEIDIEKMMRQGMDPDIIYSVSSKYVLGSKWPKMTIFP